MTILFWMYCFCNVIKTNTYISQFSWQQNSRTLMHRGTEFIPARIWHHNDSSKSLMLQCGLPPWIRLVGPAHPTKFWLDWDLGIFEAKLTPWTLSCSLNHFWTISAAWQGTSSCWRRLRPSGNTVEMKGGAWSAAVFRCVIHVKVTCT